MGLDLNAIIPDSAREHEDPLAALEGSLRMRKITASVERLSPSNFRIVTVETNCRNTVKSILGHLFGPGVELFGGNGHAEAEIIGRSDMEL